MRIHDTDDRRTAERDEAWEHVPCPGCGADDTDEALRIDDVPELDRPAVIVRCRRCSLAYLNPRPTPERIGVYYPADYVCYRTVAATRRRPLRDRWERAHRRVALGHPGTVGWRDRLAAAAHGLLVRRAIQRSEWIAYRGEARLLDVGCGGGDFLVRMRNRGWRVEGLDIGREQCARVAEATGAVVHVGTLPGAAVEPAAYDLVTFWQVLEHLHDPVATLRAARELLRPGGSIVASTPNFGSWSRQRFGATWVGLDPPRHLIHYTPETLQAVFEAAGFRVTRVVPLGMDGWIRTSASTTPPAVIDRTRRAYTIKQVATATARWSERWNVADNILVEAVPDAAAAGHPRTEARPCRRIA
jgi:2-polyprenyl-3-methyl-5-hydroxy-6-metoxy-1,4-benzoquinol methylase